MELDDRGIIAVCPSCGTKNRLAYDHLGQAVRCAKCKHTLDAPNEPIDIKSTADFDRLIAAAAVPVVVDYWAPWCGPCRMVAQELERVAADAKGQFLVLKVNTDALTDIAQEFRIRSIPTLAVIFKGRELGRVAGARSAAEIRAFADQTLADSERRAGHFARAEATLMQAQAVVTQRGEQLWIGSILRSKGDLAASRSPADLLTPERFYEEALAIAQGTVWSTSPSMTSSGPRSGFFGSSFASLAGLMLAFAICISALPGAATW